MRLVLRLTEGLGYAAGAAASPAFALGSLARRGRVLHPRGRLFAATCEPAAEPALAPVAARLAGAAVVRLSAGLWRHGREWPDVLGCAVRLRGPRAPGAEAGPSDQDLLFTTLRSLATLPLAVATTDQHHYLNNAYFTAAPFQIEGGGDRLVVLRLAPVAPGAGGGPDRDARLDDARRRGLAAFRLELRPRFRPDAPWRPLAVLRLGEPLPVAPRDVRFWPPRAGMGLTPRGFVQAARTWPYRLSQAARAAVERA
jgi:hypothetical protein